MFESDLIFAICSVPPNYYTLLTPDVTEADRPQHVYAGFNVDAINALVELLQYRLTKTTVSCSFLKSSISSMHAFVLISFGQRFMSTTKSLSAPQQSPHFYLFFYAFDTGH